MERPIASKIMSEQRPQTNIDRRSALGLTAAALAALSPAARAQVPDAAETIPLWPGIPPGGKAIERTLRTDDVSVIAGVRDRELSSIARPTLTVFRPANPDGSAILIAPGGGYSFEAIDREGI